MSASSEATPQEIYQVLEQQRKLQEVRARLAGILDKVNQSINSITVNIHPQFLSYKFRRINFVDNLDNQFTDRELRACQ